MTGMKELITVAMYWTNWSDIGLGLQQQFA
jgi:hypothetical protein